MHDVPTDPTLRSRAEAVLGWNLSRVKRRLAEIDGLPPGIIARSEEQYRRFLLALVASPATPPQPSEEALRFWNAHALFGDDYDAFRAAAFPEGLPRLPAGPAAKRQLTPRGTDAPFWDDVPSLGPPGQRHRSLRHPPPAF